MSVCNNKCLNFRDRSRERRWQHDRADDYVLSSDDRFGRNGGRGGWNNGGMGRGGGMRDYGRGGGGMREYGRGGSRFHGGRREEEAPEWFGEAIEQVSKSDYCLLYIPSIPVLTG